MSMKKRKKIRDDWINRESRHFLYKIPNICRYSLLQEGALYQVNGASYLALVAQMKNLPAMWETWVWSLGPEDTLEKEMATHSSILAWKIPWTGEHGRAIVYRVTKNQTRLSHFIFTFTLCMYILGLMYLKYHFRNKYFKINIEVSVLPLVKCNHSFIF